MRLERFGEYEFSRISNEDRLGSAVAVPNFVMTPAGAMDPNGSELAIDDPSEIVLEHEIFADSPDDLQAKLDAARALRGKRLKLYARAYSDEVRWLYARCVQVSYERTNRNFYYQKVRFRFAAADPVWHGHRREDWLLDDGFDLDDGLYLDSGSYTEVMSGGSPHYVTISNDGNKPVTSITFTITAGSADITSLVVHRTDLAYLAYSGTILAGDSLVIDCGAYSIKNDGVDNYDGVSLGVTHIIDSWARVDSGNQIYNFSFTGGGVDSTVKISYSDRWA